MLCDYRLEKARAQVAGFIGANPEQIIFTSGVCPLVFRNLEVLSLEVSVLSSKDILCDRIMGL